MADKLIFPIGFDLEEAVKQAQGDADRLLRKLETTIKSRPLAINLKIDNAGAGSINEINKRMGELVKQWNSLTEAERIHNKKSGEFTPQAKRIIAEYVRLTGATESYARSLQQLSAAARRAANEQEKNLAKQRKTTAMLKAQENSISAVTAKLQYYKKEMNSSAIGGAQFNKAANEVKRLTERLKTLQAAVNSATGASKKQAEAVKQTTTEFQKQDGYVSRLLKRLAVYATFSSVTNLLTSVREVTAQFELQRVSLGAILQDQAKANQLFGQIKSFALKSPVSIMDLTKYTKQVAAYGIEADKLFDTTKMLTDVSVGLGTDVGRLTLAFGQIRSASVLKASELRQLTEAGIPALDLLAKQLTETNGRLVTTAEVMDLISKRAISFEMVEQMFKDLTSAGGMFYDMQEKQGNTLFGLWAKLGDAASVMYDEIGNTSGVNSGMKDLIRNLSDLMRNWRNVGLVIGETVAAFALYKITAANAALVTNALTAAEVRELAVKKVHYKTQPLIIRGIIGETNARKLSIMTVRAHAAAVRSSATATNVFTKAWYSLKAAFLANPFGIVLTALTALVTYLIFADDKVKRFQEDLANIKAEGFAEATKSAYNFEQLADKAVKAADGSKEQKDALDELHRTYKDMIPIQDLTIEKLRDLKGNYDSLTQSIKEYVYQRNLQQQIDAIIAERTGTMTRIEQKLRDELKEGVKYQTSDAVHTRDLGIDDNQISALFSRIKTEAKNTSKDVRTIIKESVDEIFGYMSQEDRNLLYAMGFNKDTDDVDGWLATMTSIIELQRKMDSEIDNASTSMSTYVGNLGKYKDSLDGITEKVQKYRLVSSKGDGVERNTYLFQQGQQNFQIKEWAQSMKTELEQAGVTVQEGIFNLVQKINEGDPTKISTIDFSKLLPLLDTPEVRERLGSSYETFKNYVLSIQKSYEGIVPSDPIVQAIRSKMLSLGNATQVGMDKMKKYLWDGKGDIKDHLKTLKESAKGLEDEIYKYSNYIKLFGSAGKIALKMMGIDVDALTEEYDALTKQIQYVQTYVKETDKGKGGRTSDPRLQTLQEIANKMAEVNKEYDELLKKEGQTKALADTQKLFASSFKQMEDVAKKYNFKLPAFEVPQTVEDVQKWYKAIMDNIKRLNLKNADKVLIELGFKSDKAAIDKQQKDIETQLKSLADRISRTKTAKEFYEKILSQTGDMELAATLSFAVHGEDGKALKQQIIDNIQATLGKTKDEVNIDFTAAIRTDKSVDYDELVRIADAQLKLGNISEDTYTKILKMRDDDRKDLAKTVEGWLKATEKAKTYSDKMLDLARTTNNEIAEINRQKSYSQARVDTLLGKGTLTAEEQTELTNLQNFLAEADTLIQRFRDKQANEEAKLGFEAFKDSPMYVQMFDDLDNASTRMLENMKSRLEGMRDNWKNLDPTQLKELQSRLNEIDKQLAQRNPFKAFAAGFKKLRNLRKSGDGSANNGGKGSKSESEAGQYLIDMAKKADDARASYSAMLKKYAVKDNEALEEWEKRMGTEIPQELMNAKAELDEAMSNEEAAQKAVENWKKVKDTIGLSANELFQMLNWAGDIAKGIADISEAMGADEEDVQYWNDVASALGEISGGIQDIVQSAMSGNVVGIISSTLTAIPKMFVGFTNLFSAGKVKRANKEIRRQQQLLEQLEYTYNRLQNAADKLFGADYINNYNQQLKIMNAQAEAYRKQAEAERSKGKKADKDKIKDYENSYRYMMNEIADMEQQLTEKFTGSSRSDAAKQFVQSWIEAKTTFANTKDAILSDYKDLIQNMVIEGAAAKVIDNALAPLWKNMDELLGKNDISGAIDYMIQGMDDFLSAADDGMNILWKSLEAKGYDMKKLLGDSSTNLTGISRDIATASEEDINGLAVHMNTVEWYVAQIQQGVTAIASQGGASAGADYTDMIQQSLENQAMMVRNTAETVAECRNIAAKCQEQTELLRKVIVPKGSSASYQMSVKM